MELTNNLDSSNYGLAMINRVADLMDLDRRTAENDGRPEDREMMQPDRPMLAELTLTIILEECTDPAAFKKDMEEVARELQVRWNHTPSTEGVDLNLLRSQAYGKCVGHSVELKDCEDL